VNKLDLTENQQSILNELYHAVHEGDEVKCQTYAKLAYDQGISPLDIIDTCLTPALREVGEAFNRLEVFLPEMLISAEAMESAVKVLEPYFDKETHEQKSKKSIVILGTVKGDIHDIGKNIFRVLLEVNGYQVIDIGRDIAPSVFIDEAINKHANIIAMSGLMSTSLTIMRDTVQMLVDDGLREKFKVIIGGGPTSQAFAEKIGADGYGNTAYEGILLCDQLLGTQR